MVTGLQASCLLQQGMPLSNTHSSFLKCLGEAHIGDHCWICSAFKPRTKKDQEARLKVLLMNTVLSSSSEPSHLNSALSTSLLVQSTHPAIQEAQHRSSSLVLGKKHKKQLADRGHSPILKKPGMESRAKCKRSQATPLPPHRKQHS